MKMIVAAVLLLSSVSTNKPLDEMTYSELDALHVTVNKYDADIQRHKCYLADASYGFGHERCDKLTDAQLLGH